MKKLIIAATALIAFSNINTATAQQGFSLSVKGGPQSTWINNTDDNDDDDLDIKPLFGASFGVGAGYNFTDHLGVGLDVLYSMQGRKLEVDDKEFNQRTSYIKVPVMCVYTTPQFGIVSFTGKAGPQLSLLTSSKMTNEDGDDIVDDMNDQYEDITIGAVVNLGVQVQVAKQLYLTGGLRFDYDFTNAEDEDYALRPAGRENSNNMGAGLEVGAKFNF